MLLSVVVPTYNERENIRLLYTALERVLKPYPWDLIFVDDMSSDGTIEEIQALMKEKENVQLLLRHGPKGLSLSCVDGLGVAGGKYLVVMDADLQHDPAILPRMIREMEKENADLVIASRYIKGAYLIGFSLLRSWLSRISTFVARLEGVVNVKDPLSGYFMIRQEYFSEAKSRLSKKGSKILLDFLMAYPPHKVKEIPYTFRSRLKGQSKLNFKTIWDNICLIGENLPKRFKSKGKSRENGEQ